MKKNLKLNSYLKVVGIYGLAFCLTVFGFLGSAKEKTSTTKKGNKPMFATIDTSVGSFKVKFFYDKAPKTVDNFVGLATGTKEFTDPTTGKKTKKHFYDGLTFHRIIAGFMIQGGDPVGNGTGGPGYKFEDELTPDFKYDKPGYLAMANAGKNTNGSQFFVTVAKLGLQNDYTVFGEVVEGLDNVIAISKVPTGMYDKPTTPVVIKSVKVSDK